MKQIKVLGSGCSKCRTTIDLIEQVAKEMHVDIQIDKVQDVDAIRGYGVMSTPAVVVDNKVVHAGGLPSRDKIHQWLG